MQINSNYPNYQNQNISFGKFNKVPEGFSHFTEEGLNSLKMALMDPRMKDIGKRYDVSFEMRDVKVKDNSPIEDAFCFIFKPVASKFEKTLDSLMIKTCHKLYGGFYSDAFLLNKKTCTSNIIVSNVQKTIKKHEMPKIETEIEKASREVKEAEHEASASKEKANKANKASIIKDINKMLKNS